MSKFDISSYFWDDHMQLPKYQYEDPRELSIEILKGMKRDAKFDTTPYELEWNTQYDYEGGVAEEAKRAVEADVFRGCVDRVLELPRGLLCQQ